MTTAGFMSPHDVAAETGLSYDAVRRAIAAGDLKAAKLRRRILIRRDWFDAWIDVHVLTPTPPVVGPNGRPAPMPSPASDAPGSLDRLDAIERGEL